MISGFTASTRAPRACVPLHYHEGPVHYSWSSHGGGTPPQLPWAEAHSQHSDNTSPATSAQDQGRSTGSNNYDPRGPEAHLISTRVDWTPYFVYPSPPLAM